MNDSPPLRVLHLTGSPENERLITRQLERDRWMAEYRRVDNETDFITALAQIPDLILSDLSLPQLDGLHALHIVKERKLVIPFILISDTYNEHLATTAIEQGADDYLSKDQLARLGFSVRRVLEQKYLHESENRYQDMFENSTVAIWEEDFSQLKAELDKLRAGGVTDFRSYINEHPQFLERSVQLVKILDANTAMLMVYEAKDKSEVLVSLDRLVSSANFKEELIAFAEGESVFEREVRRETLQGKQFDLLLTVTYYKDAAGKQKALVHMTDITARKKTEENLRKTEMQYRTLAERIPPIVYMAGMEQHIGVTYVSPRIDMLGFSQEEWVADPELWFRQIHPDDQQRVLDIIEESKITGKPFKAEYRIRARDGKTLWFLDETVDILDTQENLRYRQGFMLDITDRKNAESILSSRERYMSLLNEMTRAILLSNDYDSTMRTVASNIKKIIEADDCYLVRWNEEKQTPILVATTAKLDFPYEETVNYPGEESVTASILKYGRVIAIEDVLNSPYINIEIAKRYPARSEIGIPLIAGTERLGVAIVAFNSHHLFTQEELERAEQVGNQVALALLEFQQNQEIQRRLKESNTLTEISRALSETERVGTDRVLQLIVDSARDLIQQAEESVIHLLDAEQDALVPRAISGFDTRVTASERPRIGMKEGVAGHVINTGETINIGDIHASSLYILKETLPTYRSLLVAPVRGGGQSIGTISVQSSKLDAFSASDVELLGALSIQAAIALENTRLFEATQQSLKEVNALYRTSQGLASSLDTDELIKDVVNLLQQNFGYYHVQIYLLDPITGDAVMKSGSGDTGARMLEAKTRLPRGTGIVSHVVETAMPFVANNVSNIVFFFRNPLLPDTQSEMTVPIKVDGKVVGVIDVQEKPPKKLTDNDLQLMVAVADQLSVALQRAGLYTNLQTALQQEQTVRSQLIQSERLALVGRLLASVSHELNNPLQAIQNALFLLKDEEQLSLQGKQDLDIILSEAERMASLIERLRSAYRPGRVRDFQPMELNDLIEDVYTLISTHMRQKLITFEFHPDPDLPPVSGMSDQMRQVVLNLFFNAIEVMEPGGRLSVWTQNLPQQNEVLLTVKDTGPGIAPDIFPQIFDAFITDKQTGTGLGLTISRDIIEQHFGRIEAENHPEGGAIFKVWLPIDEKGQERA